MSSILLRCFSTQAIDLQHATLHNQFPPSTDETIQRFASTKINTRHTLQSAQERKIQLLGALELAEKMPALNDCSADDIHRELAEVDNIISSKQ